DEIQTLAPLPAPAAPQRSPEQRPKETKAPVASKPAPSAGEVIRSWAESFDGESAWESCANRRAKSWLHAAGMDVAAGAESWHEDVYLKAPAAKGKQEWVLKCLWEGAPKGDPRAAARYYSAESFAGICACIAAQKEYRSIEFVDAFMAGVAELAEAHAGVKEAVGGWAGQKALLEKPTSVH
ncbi:MAG: hypothetical protein OES38_00915, partial [Gammaproteobacteria bacterium]|nr:hypothetical protein [Gammaproteobacteria bacterium]